MFIALFSIVFLVFVVIWIAAITQSIKNRWNLESTIDFSKVLIQFGGIFSIVSLIGTSVDVFVFSWIFELFLAGIAFGVLTLFTGLFSYTAIYMAIQDEASNVSIQEEELHIDATLKDEPSQ